MPAQISHLIFAEEALARAFRRRGKILLNQHGNIFRFGAQGTDFFYHNQRTKPTGLKYGIITHNEGYGRLVKNMILEAFRQKRTGPQNTPPLPIVAYILGFATHAVLDRKTHPFINYYSGWVDPEDNDSQKYYRCHAFFERILDVLILKIRRGKDIRDFNFLPLIYCGEYLPYQIIKTLLKALHASYPNIHYKSRDRKRLENAYKDTLFFYTVTDPQHPHYRQLIYIREKNSGDHRRRLALMHPMNIPTHIDFLNLKGNVWLHPCDSSLKYTYSFPDLYEQALRQAVSVLRVLWNVLMNREDPEQAETFLGNESLDSGFIINTPCVRHNCSPLPLPELIDEIYLSFTLSGS